MDPFVCALCFIWVDLLGSQSCKKNKMDLSCFVAAAQQRAGKKKTGDGWIENYTEII